MIEVLSVIGAALIVGIPLCIIFAIGVLFTKDSRLL